MIKEKLVRGTFFYQIYLYYNIFIRYKFLKRSRKTFSQFGEDIFITNFFEKNFIGQYVDLGAYHPMKLSNTYLLYKKGWTGSNVDLNPVSIDLFNIARKKDRNICCLISSESNVKKNAYIQNNWSAENFTDEDNKSLEAKNEKRKMLTKTFEEVINHNFDFLNIDLEEHDYEVLKTINLNKYNPRLICIEILKKSKNKEKIFKYMKKYNFKFIKNCNISYFFKR